MPPGEGPATRIEHRNTMSAGPNHRRSPPSKPRSDPRTVATKPVSAPCSTNSEDEKGRYSSDDPEPVGAVPLQLRHQFQFPVDVALHRDKAVVGPFVGPLVDIV